MPEMADRGSYMSISPLVAGFIVSQKTPNSPMEHYPEPGFTMVGISALCMVLRYRVNVMVKKKPVPQKRIVVEMAVW